MKKILRSISLVILVSLVLGCAGHQSNSGHNMHSQTEDGTYLYGSMRMGASRSF